MPFDAPVTTATFPVSFAIFHLIRYQSNSSTCIEKMPGWGNRFSGYVNLCRGPLYVEFCCRLHVTASQHAPTPAAQRDAASTAARASVYCCSVRKASPAMKMETVNPMPPSHDAAC